MKLQDIGFYTLCDERPEQLSSTSPMWRCEMILTERCNFNCPYCRGLREDCQGDLSLDTAYIVLDQWIAQGLRNVRFSGGEPMLYPHLELVVARCREKGVKRIAISTNGSFKLNRYLQLVEAGVNDFSISFDACCAGVCGEMSGGIEKAFERITENVRELSKLTYVTVGVVLTDTNLRELSGIIQLAHDLGVADIRIIPAAQEGKMIEGIEAVPQYILDAHPILNYRVQNIKQGRPVRSIDTYDSHRCFIPIDDSVVSGDFHFPCVIYMREQGEPIGRIGPNMRDERIAWSERHNSHTDPICQVNCLDVCVDHNNKCASCIGLKHVPTE
jgi:molybdenum cofactor biosynthesis enzyme MoaA